MFRKERVVAEGSRGSRTPFAEIPAGLPQNHRIILIDTTIATQRVPGNLDVMGEPLHRILYLRVARLVALGRETPAAGIQRCGKLSEALFADHVVFSRSFGSMWLKEAGTKGWIVLTREQRIRQRRLERESLMAARVAAFAYTGGQATALETAATIVPLIQERVDIAVSEPKPFLYTCGTSGHLTRHRVR